MSLIELFLAVLIITAAGGGGYLLYKKKGSTVGTDGNLGESKQDSSKSKEEMDNAQSRVKEIVLEAKDEAIKIKSEAEKEARELRGEAMNLEKRLTEKSDRIEQRLTEIENRDKQLKELEEGIKKKSAEVEQVRQKHIDSLEKIAGLTREQARKQLIEEFGKDLLEEKAKRIKQMEEDVKHDADKKAREILIDAMRYADTDYVSEYTVSKVKLKDEDMKGRIIGKEGRNIRALEAATGVDINIDSEVGENEVVLSSYDPVRREVAKVSLNRLLEDGRIQPAKIEEIVEKTRKDIERLMFEEGERLLHSLKVYSLPRELISYIGRYKYRFSYGQNLMRHTLEETKLGVKIAHELGVDVNVVKLGCLFHDIGKVITEKEGSHVALGVELLKKYGIDERVIACVAEHHEDQPFSSLESVVVHIADSISGARPGARYEDYSEYVNRMSKLEEAAKSFGGVKNAYAISAGREVRVIVSPSKIGDNEASKMAYDIARKIESEQTFPGTVKVNVIRESRFAETAS